ncbi:MAG TPA: PolC-type DNA polymerase III [Erysipelothrix sp.]|nr:PolC-type DNA polymerase III [Erysipelothrix sp.]
MKTYELLEKINCQSDFFSAFKNNEIKKVVYHKNKNTLSLLLEAYEPVSVDVINYLNSQLQNTFQCDIDLSFVLDSKSLDYDLFHEYLTAIISKHQLRDLILNTTVQINDDQIVFQALNRGEQDYINQVLQVINDELKKLGVKNFCECQLVENDVVVIEEAVYRQKFENAQPVKVNQYANNKKKSFEDYTKVTISMLVDECHDVYFEGQLFKIDERETRTGNTVLTLYFTDYDDAIETTLFFKNASEFELAVGDWALVYGSYIFDNYRKSNSFKNNQITRIESPYTYKDKAEIKRIELHAHTKASEMDGVSDVSSLITQAYNYGHSAIAITDHTAVHSFPAAQRTASSLNKLNPDKQIKVIYGVEMNVVDDELKILRGHNSFDFETGSFVLFDLETTGLSSQYDHIIEFGGVKFENGMVTESLQLFVKPPISIPKRITQITQISDEHVKDAPTLEDVFSKILDFIGDSVLVAHNAMFDYRFLQAAAQKLNLQPITNSLIDTLSLSWALIDNRRSYTLGAVARYYSVEYDDKVAHRADYDAQVLHFVFVRLVEALRLKGVNTSQELLDFQKSISTIDKLRPYHAIVLAKNSKGLKSLYKLVSMSHTEMLMYRGKSSKKEDESIAEARITRQAIEENRENLLIGSACFNSYLFEVARTASQAELEEEMKFYDYIELQPLENYNPLLYFGSIFTQEQLIGILKNIFMTAHKLNIPVVATGDVHYVLSHEKVFREIYINAMGIGGAKHPLYIYDENLRATQASPDQHLRTTQEMLEGYPYLSKAEAKRIVITNPLKISDQIEEVMPIPKDLYTPSIEESDEKLTKIVYDNAKALYGDPLPEIVLSRIKKELTSIISNGFGVIYYTSHLLVKRSMDDGYMVGSRGSVGSSLVATLANITEVNPLVPHYVCQTCHHSEFFTQNEYASGYDLPSKKCPVCESELLAEGQDIPFETFLGFEGDKVPDIDLNFSSDYQEVAHAYTKELFGEDKVLRAGTIGTIAEKTAFGLVSGFYENVPPKTPKHNAYREFLIGGAAGVKRSTGQHPGGIVVIPKDKDILDFTPYQYPANNPEAAWKTTHYEYHDLENNLLKLDILGHVDPTAMKFLGDVSELDVNQIPLNDPKTMSIFSSTDALMLDHRRQRDPNGAVGLPEFGTPFVRRMLEDTSPKKFSDLVRISGLSHGTDVWLKNAQSIIQNGYTLDDVIACRDDIMTYLTHIGVPEKTSFNIMESVRRGRGLKPEWIEEMTSRGVQDWYIQSAQMIKYLFPKAHAVAYCIMGFRVAWFKVHRPRDFYAQFFTLRCSHYEISTMLGGADVIEKRLNDIMSRRGSYNIEDKISAKEEGLISTLEVAYEMSIRGYYFKPMNLHECHADKFWPDPHDPKAILVAFNAVDGLGTSVAHRICEQRQEREFLSIEDFKRRTQINQNALNELKSLNVLDELSEFNQLSLF